MHRNNVVIDLSTGTMDDSCTDDKQEKETPFPKESSYENTEHSADDGSCNDVEFIECRPSPEEVSAAVDRPNSGRRRKRIRAQAANDDKEHLRLEVDRAVSADMLDTEQSIFSSPLLQYIGTKLLQMQGPIHSPLPHSLHSRNLLKEFHDSQALYINKIRLDTGEAESEVLPMVCMKEIFSGRCLKVLLVTGMCSTIDHQLFFRKYLPKGCKVTYVSANDYSMKLSGDQWPFETNWVTAPMDFTDREKVIVNKYGSQHSKLHIILYDSFLRVMITSANGYDMEWEEAGQIIWCLDIPSNRRNSSNQLKTPAAKPHPFASSLVRFLEALLGNNQEDEVRCWIGYVLYDFDFSVCGDNVDLVASIPGIHVASSLDSDVFDTSSSFGMGDSGIYTDESNMFGLRKIHRLISRKFPAGFFRLKRSSKGGQCQSDCIESIVSSVSNYSYNLHASLVKAFGGHDEPSWGNVRLIFPSQKRLKELCTNGETIRPLSKGLGLLRLSGKFTLAANFPLRKHRLLHEYISCSAQRPARDASVQHTKMYLRESTANGDSCGKGWIYAGSANLSFSAWGSISSKPSDKKKKVSTDSEMKYRINSFELGVLLTNVKISDYTNVIPWSRNDLDSWQYDADLAPISSFP